MRQTWRWFGQTDFVTVDAMLQAGVEGVVTALHHVPTGAVWTPEEIAKRRDEITHMMDGAPSGLSWEVVESLPVSEQIKKQAGEWRSHIEAYKTSLRNIAEAGINVVCYNFMPVLDWTRTDLRWQLKNGATCMRFNIIDFAAFDIFILERQNAAADFPEEIARAARRRFDEMSESDKKNLTQNIVCGLPGAAETFTLEGVRQQLAEYNAISAERLRSNFISFLSEVIPVAEKVGVRMCCHPDDPPFNLLGLPRIMSTEEDYRKILNAVDSPANGATLCMGSLGARPDNDLPGMIDRLADRVHFLHLRNVKRDSTEIRGSFYEAEHLNGDNDMVAIIDAILREEARRKAAGRADWSIPIRPDHGQNILDDLNRDTQPGYPAIGRLRGLAEVRGIMTALSYTKAETK